MRRLVIALIVVAVVSVAVCGDEDGGGGDQPAETTTEEAQPSKRERAATRRENDRCEKAPRVVVNGLKDGLKRGKLASAYGVRSSDEFTGPAGLQEGVYFVSANVKPNPGVATWGVSAEVWKTGGGLIFAIDKAARSVTDFGADVDPSIFGLTESAEGYEESRECAGG